MGEQNVRLSELRVKPSLVKNYNASNVLNPLAMYIKANIGSIEKVTILSNTFSKCAYDEQFYYSRITKKVFGGSRTQTQALSVTPHESTTQTNVPPPRPYNANDVLDL